MNEPKVSVIVPIYNTEKELPRCVQSIRGQTFSNIEIILVDDGSTDSCPQLCDAYASEDPRVCVLHKENGGLSDARNTGLLNAKGEYILYVDSDDFIEKDAIEQLLRGALPGVDLIAGAYYDLYKDGKRILLRRTGLKDGKIYTAKDFFISSINNRVLKFVSWSYMYRRDYLIENELFFRKGYIWEDMDLILDLILHTDNIIIIDYPFYNHEYRDGSITQSEKTWKKAHDFLKITERWKETIDKVKDKTLQKYLYSLLVSNYMFTANVLNLKGWWIPNINFRFAFNHAIGLRKVKVMQFELKTIYYSLFSPHSEFQRLPAPEYYKLIDEAGNNSVKKEENKI